MGADTDAGKDGDEDEDDVLEVVGREKDVGLPVRGLSVVVFDVDVVAIVGAIPRSRFTVAFSPDTTLIPIPTDDSPSRILLSCLPRLSEVISVAVVVVVPVRERVRHAGTSCFGTATGSMVIGRGPERGRERPSVSVVRDIFFEVGWVGLGWIVYPRKRGSRCELGKRKTGKENWDWYLFVVFLCVAFPVLLALAPWTNRLRSFLPQDAIPRRQGTAQLISIPENVGCVMI